MEIVDLAALTQMRGVFTKVGRIWMHIVDLAALTQGMGIAAGKVELLIRIDKTRQRSTMGSALKMRVGRKMRSIIEISGGTGVRRKISGGIQHAHKLRTIGVPGHAMTTKVGATYERGFHIYFRFYLSIHSSCREQAFINIWQSIGPVGRMRRSKMTHI